MFSTPKNKRPRVQQRSNTPDVDMVNHQMQETHVTSPQSEGPKVDNDKEQVSRVSIWQVSIIQLVLTIP